MKIFKKVLRILLVLLIAAIIGYGKINSATLWDDVEENASKDIITPLPCTYGVYSLRRTY